MRLITLFPVALLVATPAVGQEAASAPTMAPAPTTKIADMFDPAPAEKGQIIFYRPGGAGGLVGCMVREGEGADEKHLSKLTGNRYFVHLAEPGVHKYWVKSEATDRLALEIEPGETYFVKCTISMGFLVGRPNLSPSDITEFKTKQKKLKVMVAAEADDKDEDAKPAKS